MPDVITELGNTLFQWQKGWAAAATSGIDLDAALRQAFERVAGQRVFPCLTKHVDNVQASAVVDEARRLFGQLRGSIHPGEVGRFCHAACHTALGLEHPEQAWRDALLADEARVEEEDKLQLASIELARELDASRPHAVPMPIKAWVPALLGLVAGFAIGWLVFGVGLSPLGVGL